MAEKLGAPRPGGLPADMVWRGKGFTIYVPIVACVVLSFLPALVFSLFRR